MQLRRLTICVDRNSPSELHSASDWFQRWRSQLAFCSENLGCGCCVDIWEVEAPEEALDQLPSDIVAE